MYTIHKTSEKEEEKIVNDETLDQIFQRKKNKLIIQIKTQKILHPEIEVQSMIDAINDFKEGGFISQVEGIWFELRKDPQSFYICKKFAIGYKTMRYYSLSKDRNYEYFKKVNLDQI